MSSRDEQPAAEIAWSPLLVAIVIMLLLTLLPSLAADASGKADHTAAMLLFAAMSAGFVRGVGFIPLNKVARVIFSGWSCAVFLTLALIKLVY